MNKAALDKALVPSDLHATLRREAWATYMSKFKGKSLEEAVAAGASLEEAVEESRERARKLRVQWPLRDFATRSGLVAAISKLMISGEFQGGFKKMVKHRETDWTLESVVRKFRDDFGSEVVEAAEFRLEQARRGEF